MNLPVYEPYRHFDYNLEGAILGACLLEKFAISRILSVIEDESIFYNEANRIVFKAMLAMLDESMPIDIFTVSQFIVNRMKIRELGEGNVAYYLVKLTNAVVSTANLEVHAFLLLECWKQRKLVEIKYGAIDSDLSAGENIDSITESLNKVMRSKMSADWLPMDELLIQLYQHQAEMEKAKGIGLLTGFNTIDRNGGFFAPNFVLLGARPGVGKSAFANSIAINVAKQNKTVGIISLEMGNVEIASRLAAIDTKTDFSLVFRGLINDERESRNFHETLNNQTAGLPIYVSDKTGVTMPEIRRRAEVLKHRKGVDLLIIDYLQLIDTHNSNNRSRENEIAVISRGLKILAKDLDIPILVLAQLNRESTKRTGEQRYPVLGDIRESGCLSGDTKIQVQNKKKTYRIKDLVHRNKINIIASYLNKNKSMKASNVWETGEKEVFNMVLNTGMSIKATGNHRFLKEDGSWMPLSELSVMDKVAVPIYYEPFADETICDAEVSLLGHFLANGCALKGRPICYTCNIEDNDLASQVIKDALIATNNLIAPAIKDTILPKSKFKNIFFKPTFHLTHGVTSPMGDIFKKHGLWDKRAKEKFIPDCLFYLNHRQTKLLLKSLFSGDGCAYYRESKGRKQLMISYSSSSTELIFGIQLLLAKIGIISIVREVVNKKSQMWYNLSITGKSNIEMYVNGIGFWNKRKNDIMVNGWHRIKNNISGWSLIKYNNERTLAFVPIKSIESAGVETVYDIEMPISHNFKANGILVHNSLEQDTDIVFFLHSDFLSGVTQDREGRSTEGYVELINRKWRNFKLGETKKLRFNGKLMQFTDMDESEQFIAPKGFVKVENTTGQFDDEF